MTHSSAMPKVIPSNRRVPQPRPCAARPLVSTAQQSRKTAISGMSSQIFDKRTVPANNSVITGDMNISTAIGAAFPHRLFKDVDRVSVRFIMTSLYTASGSLAGGSFRTTTSVLDRSSLRSKTRERPHLLRIPISGRISRIDLFDRA